MAEWLGRGLQNLVRRFDSVWYLKQKTAFSSGLFLFVIVARKSLYFHIYIPLGIYSS